MFSPGTRRRTPDREGEGEKNKNRVAAPAVLAGRKPRARRALVPQTTTRTEIAGLGFVFTHGIRENRPGYDNTAATRTKTTTSARRRR